MIQSIRARFVVTLVTSVTLASAGAAWGQSRGSSEPQREDYQRTPRQFSLDLSASGVFDTNINHDTDDIDSHGMLAGIEARLRSSPRRPALTLSYEGTVQSFSGTDRWDRLEHQLDGRIAQYLGPVTLETTARLDFGSATEDRELSNQFTVRPRIGLSVGAARVRVYGAYRLKGFDLASELQSSDPDMQVGLSQLESTEEAGVPNERIRYVGAEFRWKAGGGSSWQLGYRYETSDSDNPDRRYIRRRYTAEYRADVSDRSALELGLEYRPRRFLDQRVQVESLDEETGEVSESEELRRDIRWVPYVSLGHTFPWGQEVEVSYEFQRRTSNDPEEEFEAHQVTLSVRLPIISRYRTARVEH